MESWIPFFVAVTAIAVVVQVVILAALAISLRKTSERLGRIAEDVHQKLDPVLVRLKALADDTQPRLTAIVANVAEMTELARGQAYKMDRVLGEAVDRLRAQVVRADQIVTGAMTAVEGAGVQFKRTLWGPVTQAAAVIQGIRAGLDLFRERKRPPEGSRASAEDELFI